MKKFVNPWENQNPWQQGGEYHNLALDVPTVGEVQEYNQRRAIYTPRGQFLGRYENNWTATVYCKYASGKEESLGVDHGTFIMFASLVFRETSARTYNWRECFSIANAVINYIRERNNSDWTLQTLVSKPNHYSYAVEQGHLDDYIENNINKSEGWNKKGEIAAIINAIKGWNDYSMGSTGWDGEDLVNIKLKENQIHRDYNWKDQQSLLQKHGDFWKKQRGLEEDKVFRDFKIVTDNNWDHETKVLLGGTLFYLREANVNGWRASLSNLKF